MAAAPDLGNITTFHQIYVTSIMTNSSSRARLRYPRLNTVPQYNQIISRGCRAAYETRFHQCSVTWRIYRDEGIKVSQRTYQVLVTGPNGFIGQNLLCVWKKCMVLLYSFTREDDPSSLADLMAQVDTVIHLAGENGPKDDAAFVIISVSRRFCATPFAQNIIRPVGKLSSFCFFNPS